MSDQAHPTLPIKAAQLRLSNLAASQLPLPGASPADVERLSPTRLTAAKRSASRRGCLGQLLGSPRGGTGWYHHLESVDSARPIPLLDLALPVPCWKTNSSRLSSQTPTLPRIPGPPMTGLPR